jgi:hypothetical protein
VTKKELLKILEPAKDDQMIAVAISLDPNQRMELYDLLSNEVCNDEYIPDSIWCSIEMNTEVNPEEPGVILSLDKIIMY